MTSRHFSPSARWIALAVLGAVTLLFFWRYFLLDQTLYAGDTAFVFVPFRQFLTEHLAMGKLPLWNPFLFGGTPALAESQYQVFYPINLLMLPLGAARGMGWILALHLFIMGVGTFLFLRQSLELKTLPALLGAVAFAFGATIQSRLSIPVYTDAATWLPWILWGYDRARLRGGAWIGAAPVFLALQLCTGAAQYSYYTLALLAGYHFFGPKPGRDAEQWRGGAVLAWTLGAGALLAMAQLLPELELARLSDRGTKASYEFAISGSLAPHHFALSALFPKFFGLYAAAPLDGFMASVESSYTGAATLALWGAATAFERRAAVWFWAAVALVSLLMALGGNNPLYPLLYRFLPGTSTFRGPANWLLLFSFSGATLGALGLQAILNGNRAAQMRALGLSVILFLTATAILLSPLGAQIYAAPDAPFAPWAQVALFGVVALICALLWKTPRVLSARRLGAVLLLVTVFDLFSVSRDMELSQTVLASDLETTPPAVARLKAVSAPVAPPRFWSANSATPLEAWQRGETLSGADADLFRARQGLALRSLMPSCVAAQFGAPGLTGAWGALMPLRRHPHPIYESSTPLETKLRWLRLLGASYHIGFGPPLQNDWPLISSEPPAIYRDDKALPRAFWIGKVVPVTPENALSVVSSAGFDPTRQVALETDAPQSATPAPSSLPLQAASFSRYDETRVELQINAPAAGHLVMMDSVYPGWRARVDGRETPILPANFTGRALEISQGNHQIELWFEPTSVRLGVFVSLMALGLVSAVSLGNRGNGRRR